MQVKHVFFILLLDCGCCCLASKELLLPPRPLTTARGSESPQIKYRKCRWPPTDLTAECNLSNSANKLFLCRSVLTQFDKTKCTAGCFQLHICHGILPTVMPLTSGCWPFNISMSLTQRRVTAGFKGYCKSGPYLTFHMLTVLLHPLIFDIVMTLSSTSCRKVRLIHLF